jgi:hypothetical protein
MARAAVAASAGAWNAAKASWNDNALVPAMDMAWDDYTGRLFRYAHFSNYYTNTVYSSLLAYAAQHKRDRKLYKHIRGVYNPVARLVEIYVDKVYGGPLDLQELSQGAIPIETDNDALRDAIKQLWLWSNWGTQKSLYVRSGATRGDIAIKLVDDRRRQKVRMELVHPGKIKIAVRDEVGNVKAITLEYDVTETFPDGTEETYTYKETIDKEWFRTFKNGEPFAYYEDMTGNPVYEWPNEYGFVPVVLCKHKDLGMEWGAPPFFTAVRKIDELNDAASLLNDYTRIAIRPVFWAAGVRKKDELEIATEYRDQFPMVYAPGGSQPHAMVFPLDIGAALQNTGEMLQEIERDMPELALHRLRQQGGDLTAPGVRAAFDDALGRIVEARGNYDDALVRAHQMGIAIGGYNRYDGFSGFGLESYDKGDLEHVVAERPVIEDNLSLQERLQFLSQSGAPPEAIWRELNIAEEKITEWNAKLEERRQQFLDNVDGADEQDGVE